MKIVLFCFIILTAGIATAETIIIEYPDHYYVESVDIPAGKPAHLQENSVPPSNTIPAIVNESSATPASARPETNFDSSPQPVDPAERRSAMEKEIQRLQWERSELMAPKHGESPDQADIRHQAAAGKLRKINKISSELLKISVQGNEQGKQELRP